MLHSDAELIRSFLAGEAAAIATLDTWIESAAWSYRLRLGHDWDDLLQDVRLELTRLLTAGRFRGESQLKTYIWRVVNHACLDRLRAQLRRRWVDLDGVVESLENEGLLAAPSASDPTMRDLAQRVLARASAECRRLWMMVVAGLSYAEMSERLEVAEGTLRVRVLRCRKKAVEIRSELDGQGAIEEL
ncbi:MAG: sigma-70 family RNA polymerase sigma factor [Thermoanaerobaculia bacterium]|nr:sigma-70 family RNA polymerase sigma factor [Thermoanaerobaculia bacterium]